MSRSKIAVFTGSKGRGSNMAAIISATKHPDFPAEVAVVVTPNPDTLAGQSARDLGVPTVTINPKSHDYSAQVQTLLSQYEIKLICLAGFMSLFPEEIVTKYATQIINIHPALLPSFGGKGMYGMHVHHAVIESGVDQTGCTVHYVSERYDEGHIILQKTCLVQPDDTPESIAKRVLELEHIAYPEAIFNLLTAK